MPKKRPFRRAIGRAMSPDRRDGRAERLALLAAIVLLRSELLVREHHPLGPTIEERLTWLRGSLRPLAKRSGIISEVLPMLRDDNYLPDVDEPKRLRRTLRDLAARARAVSTARSQPRSGRRA